MPFKSYGDTESLRYNVSVELKNAFYLLPHSLAESQVQIVL